MKLLSIAYPGIVELGLKTGILAFFFVLGSENLQLFRLEGTDAC
jgi:hypothetical protein